MDDRARPEAAPAPAETSPAAAPLDDPRALTILTTEHWGLLTARSLVYNESFSRGAMFLTLLSASLVALGFVAGGVAAGPELPLVAIAVLALDLFVGFATLGRMVGAGREEISALQGMARLRHAYLELVPGLDAYFVNPSHDDIGSVLSAYGNTAARPNSAQSVLHGMTTMPGLVAVIDAALAGALAAMVALALGVPSVVSLAAGVAAGLATMTLLATLSNRVFMAQGRSLEARFPAPAR
jgi:hypothetical protein